MIQRLTEFINCQRRYNSLKIELDEFLKILDRHLKNFSRDQRGVTAIEYGLIAVLISVVVLGTLGSTGLNLGGLYSEVFGEVEDSINEANNE